MLSNTTTIISNIPNVWTRRAELLAAPVKPKIETFIELKPETTESELKPVNLAQAFEAEVDFKVQGTKGRAANLARMQRKAAKANIMHAALWIEPDEKAEPVAQPKEYVKQSYTSNVKGFVQTFDASANTKSVLGFAADVSTAATKLPHTYTIIFKEKVTEGLTFDRLHKATKRDLILAQNKISEQCIEEFKYALENDKLLQCIDHISTRFQMRKYVSGALIVEGEHTFLASDIIKNQTWVYKTRTVLNELQPLLHVSFYFDNHTAQVVMSLKKA